jgi:hypothetical protein
LLGVLAEGWSSVLGTGNGRVYIYINRYLGLARTILHVVYTVLLAEKSLNLRLYTVCIYGSGQPYRYNSRGAAPWSCVHGTDTLADDTDTLHGTDTLAERQSYGPVYMVQIHYMVTIH